MGDRAVIYIEGASCAVYLHWGGHDVRALLAKAAPTMRPNDPDYATARLVAAACAMNPPPTGVGVLPPPADFEPETLRSYSHGDFGVAIIAAEGGPVRTTGGYGLRTDEEREADYDRNELLTSDVMFAFGGGR